MFNYFTYLHSLIFLGFADQHQKNWKEPVQVTKVFSRLTKLKNKKPDDMHPEACKGYALIHDEYRRKYDEYMNLLFAYYFGKQFRTALDEIGAGHNTSVNIVASTPRAKADSPSHARFMIHLAHRYYVLSHSKLTLPSTYLDTHYPLPGGLPRILLIRRGLEMGYFRIEDIGTEIALCESHIANTEHELQLIRAIASTTEIHLSEIAGLKSQIADLEVKLQSSKISEKEFDNLRNEVLKAQAELACLELMSAEETKKPSKRPHSKSRKKNSDSMSAQLNKDLQRAREEKNSAVKELREIQHLQKQSDTERQKAHSAELKEKDNLINDLKRTIKKGKKTLKKLQDDLHEHRKETIKTASEKETLIRFIDTLGPKIDEFEHQNQQMDQELKSTQKEIASLRQRVAQSESSCTQLERKFESVTQEKDNKIKELQEQIAQLEDSLETEELYYRAACEDNKRGADFYQALSSQYNQLVLENERLVARIQSLEKNLEEIRKISKKSTEKQTLANNTPTAEGSPNY